MDVVDIVVVKQLSLLADCKWLLPHINSIRSTLLLHYNCAVWTIFESNYLKLYK